MTKQGSPSLTRPYANFPEVYGHFAILNVLDMGGTAAAQTSFHLFPGTVYSLTGGQGRREDGGDEEQPRDVHIHHCVGSVVC